MAPLGRFGDIAEDELAAVVEGAGAAVVVVGADVDGGVDQSDVLEGEPGDLLDVPAAHVEPVAAAEDEAQTPAASVAKTARSFTSLITPGPASSASKANCPALLLTGAKNRFIT